MTTVHKQFFGDKERSFQLDPEMIEELERKAGCGIGLLTRRVIAREFMYTDLTETVRLSLIGAGTPAEEAARLVKVYGLPIDEIHAIALAVLSKLWWGAKVEEGEDTGEDARSAERQPEADTEDVSA